MLHILERKKATRLLIAATAAVSLLAFGACESHNRGGDSAAEGSSDEDIPAKNDNFFFEICQRPSNPPDIEKTVQVLKSIAGTADCGEANVFFDKAYSLDLSGKGISNLLPIKGFFVLTQLVMDNNDISSLDPLSGLKRLTLVSAASNRITSVSPLAMLDSLNTIMLDNNSIESIFALRALPAVQRFSMSKNPLGDGPIKKTNGTCDPNSKSPAIAAWCSPNTAFLRICNDGSTADKDDRYTVNVIKAMLKGTSCEDANLKLTKLKKLMLPAKQIVSVVPLRGLKQLELLDLSYNFIEDIGPLSNLEGLTNLQVYSNKIEDITAIQYMPRLTVLNISFNYIKDFMPLKNLTLLINDPNANEQGAFRAEYNPLRCREFLKSEYCKGARLPIEANEYNCPFNAKSVVVADWCRYGPNYRSNGRVTKSH